MATTGSVHRRAAVISEETVPGTTDATPTSYLLRCTDIQTRAAQSLIDIPAYRGDRRQGIPIPDLIDAGLTITAPVYIDEIGWWLKWGVANPKTTGSSVFTHTGKVGYSEDVDGDIEGGLSIEVQYRDLDTPLYQVFTGCRISTWKLSFQPGGGLFVTMEIVARAAGDFATSSVQGTPTEYTSLPLSQADVTSIKEGGSTNAICRGGEFRVNNDLATDIYYVGGLLNRGDLTTGQAIVDGTVTYSFQSVTLAEKGTNGTETALEIIWTQGATTLTIEAVEMLYVPTQPTAQGSALVLAFEWKAFEGNDADAAPLKYILLNAVTSY